MNRKLIFLNIVLAAGVAAAGWQWRENQRKAREREKAFLSKPVTAPAVAPYVPAEPPKPVEAAGYLNVAQQMLFSRDRNPNVVIEAVPEKPVPAFPAAHGVLAMGDEVSVILSEAGKTNQKSYRKGDSVGPFAIASLTPEEIVFEWEGKEFKKAIADLKLREPLPQAAAPPPPDPDARRPEVRVNTAASTPKEVFEETQKPTPGLPGISTGGPDLVCAPGDSSPPGTVQGGWRKVVTRTPFGSVCRWVAVQ